jgi:hypothetical protein
MRSRPLRQRGLFSVPVDEETRSVLLPFAEREGEFSFALPQAAIEAYESFTLPGQAARGELGAPGSPEMMEAASRFGVDYGMLPALAGGLLTPVSPNTLRMGRGPTKAELDPLGYGKVKSPKKVSESVAITEEATKLAPKKEITIEDLQGSLLFPLMGDQSATGLLLKGLDEVQFERPVSLEGGPGFMRGEAAQKESAVWASGKGVISDIKNRVQRASEETGLPVNMIYVAMGKDAIDFATFPAEALAEQIPFSKITSKAAKDFDSEMKKVDKSWPGVMSENIRDYLTSASSDIRKKFVRTMDKAPAQNAGFPSVGLTRAAVTDAELKDALPGESGFTIGKMNLDSPVIQDPSVPHSTYPAQLAGHYIGGLLTPVPKEMVFRDFYRPLEGARTESGKLQSPSMKDYTFRLNLPTQLVDQELVDTIMKYSLLGKE